MSYKAESLGKTAQHVYALGVFAYLDQEDTVNDAVAQWKFTFLPGEV